MQSVHVSSMLALLGALSFVACSGSDWSGFGGSSATSATGTTDATGATSATGATGATTSASGGAPYTGVHPRAAYYINFQDPKGKPADDPLVVDGHTWAKIGWDAYDPTLGRGWAGPHIGDPAIMLYKYFPNSKVNELQRSVIYNDYGRVDTFTWDIENGSYKVTVSIGFDTGTYSKNKVIIEGQTLFDSVETNPVTPYLVKSIVVGIVDGNVTMEAGQKNEFTMLNWMSIEPDGPCGARGRAARRSAVGCCSASPLRSSVVAASAAAVSAAVDDLVGRPPVTSAHDVLDRREFHPSCPGLVDDRLQGPGRLGMRAVHEEDPVAARVELALHVGDDALRVTLRAPPVVRIHRPAHVNGVLRDDGGHPGDLGRIPR